MTKKFRMIVLVLLLSALMLFPGANIIKGLEDKVNFGCNNLYKALITAGVDKNNDGIISKTELAAVSRLDLRGKGISDLTGLEYAVNLEQLFISHNNITDLSRLSRLSSLIWLEAEDNEISDISPIAGMKGLKYLNLSHNLIDRLAGIESRNLVWLELADNRLEEIFQISHVPCLEYLDLSSNAVYSLEGIEPLADLKSLNLKNNSLNDISQLNSLNGLIYLNISGNNIISIEDISGNTRLEWLEAADNKMEEISILKSLPELKRIYIQNNYIEDISPISGLKNLLELDIEQNYIDFGLKKNTDIIDKYTEKGVKLTYLPQKDPQLPLIKATCKGLAIPKDGIVYDEVRVEVKRYKSITVKKGAEAIDFPSDGLFDKTGSYTINAVGYGKQQTGIDFTIIRLPKEVNLKNGYFKITGFPLKVAALSNEFGKKRMEINVYTGNNRAVDKTQNISTGMSISVYIAKKRIRNYTVFLSGDVDGNGDVTSADILLLKSVIMGEKAVKGAYYLAGDIYEDSGINSLDLFHIRRLQLGLE